MNIAEAVAFAVRCHAAGRLGDAENIYREILQRDPRNIDALHNMAVIFGQRGNVEQAVKCFRQLLTIEPRHAATHYNLGLALEKLGRLDEALESYQNAVKCKPDYTAAWNNLGILLAGRDMLKEAVDCYRRAVSVNDKHVEALNNLGNALTQLGRPQEAIPILQRAIVVNPNHASAHFNLGLAFLMCGDYQRGWEEYEWRWQREDLRGTDRHLPQLLWDGSDISKRTLLLHTEQGFGDAIQFVRFATVVAEKGAKVVVECQPELASLFRTVAGVSRVVARGETVPYFDAHAPLLSLPRLLGMTSVQQIPAKAPYVSAELQKVAAWRELLAKIQPSPQLRVGLAWAGKPSHKHDRYRSLVLSAFAPLAELQDVAFFSLQKGVSAQIPEGTAGVRLIDLSADLADFADTAALIENLDLVISADTAAAHLAGALGKPVWTLLAGVSDWRWMRDREDTPWYPTMRLFRQSSLGDWREPIERVKAALGSKI